jgi:hypothetical protein
VFDFLYAGWAISLPRVIPPFGDAYVDLLGAFVPFTFAALYLCLIAWSE